MRKLRIMLTDANNRPELLQALNELEDSDDNIDKWEDLLLAIAQCFNLDDESARVLFKMLLLLHNAFRSTGRSDLLPTKPEF